MAKRKFKDSAIELLDTIKAPLLWGSIAGLWYFQKLSPLAAVGSVFGTVFLGAVGIGLIQRTQAYFQNRTFHRLQMKAENSEQLVVLDKKIEQQPSATQKDNIEVVEDQKKAEETDKERVDLNTELEHVFAEMSEASNASSELPKPLSNPLSQQETVPFPQKLAFDEPPKPVLTFLSPTTIPVELPSPKKQTLSSGRDLHLAEVPVQPVQLQPSDLKISSNAFSDKVRKRKRRPQPKDKVGHKRKGLS